MNNYISIRLNLLSITDKWLSNHPIIQILIYFFISVFIYVDVSTPHSISYSVPSYIVESNISKHSQQPHD